MHVRTAPPGPVDDRVYRWDGMYDKTRREDQLPGPQQHAYTYDYDSTYRLVGSDPDGPVPATGYTLDGVSNRTLVTGGPAPGPYVLDATAPVPADFQVNQYTETPFDDRGYDENGNLVLIVPQPPQPPGPRTVEYDYRDQMVRHTGPGGVTTFRYDALGRRFEQVAPGGMTVRYFHDGRQVIEERDGVGATLATYVHGFDGQAKGARLRANGEASPEPELLSMQRSAPSPTCVVACYYHTDDAGNVMVVTDATGAVAERYEYGDYGQPVDPGTLLPIVPPQAPSSIGNPYLFASRRYDTGIRWYHRDARYLDPRAGRFTTADETGAWAVPTHRGNSFAFAADNPWSDRRPGSSGPGGAILSDGWWGPRPRCGPRPCDPNAPRGSDPRKTDGASRLRVRTPRPLPFVRGPSKGVFTLVLRENLNTLEGFVPPECQKFGANANPEPDEDEEGEDSNDEWGPPIRLTTEGAFDLRGN